MDKTLKRRLDAEMRAEGILKLLHLLEQGPYADIGHQTRPTYQERNDSLSLDAAINHSYEPPSATTYRMESGTAFFDKAVEGARASAYIDKR